MFALLGDIQFDLITYFDGLGARFSATYAEHALIEGKPRLQHIADDLDDFQIDLRFHASYCDPEKELTKILNAIRDRKAMAFVLGNGDYKGWFVAVALDCTSKQADANAGLIELEASLTLREYVGDKRNTSTPPGILPQLPPVVAHVQNNSHTPIKASVVQSNVSLVVSNASQARSALQSALIVFDLAQKLRSNPVAALNQLPSLATSLARISHPLATMSNSAFGLPSATDTSLIVNAGVTSLQTLRNAQNLISNTNINNVVSQINLASVQLSNTNNTLDQASSSISRLAALVSARGI